MKLLNLFRKKKTVSPAAPKEADPINRNYVCIPSDPIDSMNDLREGDWNMDKVQRSLNMGMLRYARQSEIDKAYEIGRLKKI